jgi:hypothetical protein
MDLELVLETAAHCLAPKPVGFNGDICLYDKAIIGLTDNGQLVYSKEIMVKILMEVDNGTTEDEATEFLEFNTFNTYLGEQTPIYVNTYTF